MDYVRKRAQILQTKLNTSIFPDQLPSDAKEYHSTLRESQIDEAHRKHIEQEY